MRDVATGVPMSTDTIFALHSMTKPITSVAAMMLVDEGKLSLDDPLSKYIPSFGRREGRHRAGRTADGADRSICVPPDRPVTIADLMRHTAGISYEYIGSDADHDGLSGRAYLRRPFNNTEFAERIAKLPLARQPGTFWRYGHSTDVLGRVIEIDLGQAALSVHAGTIFDPLGMTSTKFVLADDAERARMAEPLPNDTVLRLSEEERRKRSDGNPAAAAWSRPSPIMRALRRCC